MNPAPADVLAAECGRNHGDYDETLAHSAPIVSRIVSAILSGSAKFLAPSARLTMAAVKV
jgi:hypothetical protein